MIGYAQCPFEDPLTPSSGIYNGILLGRSFNAMNHCHGTPEELEEAETYTYGQGQGSQCDS